MNSHVKNFQASFFRHIDSREIPFSLEGRNSLQVWKKHRCSGGHQSCFVEVDVLRVFSFVEAPVDLHFEFGFIDRDFGYKEGYNALQLSIIRALYEDTILIRHIVNSIARHSSSDEVPKEAKVPGTKSLPLYMCFELAHRSINKVMLCAELRLGDKSLYCYISQEIGGDEVRQETITCLGQIIAALRKHYSLSCLRDDNELVYLYPGSTKL